MASSLELFHISNYISVPGAALIVWLLVVKGTYKSVEKVFLAASFFYFAYIIAGVLAGPSWKEAFVATFKPPHSGALPRFVVHLHGDCGGGNHDCALDAVLLAIVHRGEGNLLRASTRPRAGT